MNSKKTCAVLWTVMSFFVLLSAPADAQQLKTRWADEAAAGSTWKSYPRPQLQRQQWENLNGFWEYSVTDQQTAMGAVNYEGKILVPFCIESQLSGVDKAFGPEDKLWYKRSFSIDKSWKGSRILLHFGAVDYECTVWVDGKVAGSHVGGNNPFHFDITDCLKGNGSHTLVVGVTDPTDTKSQPRGKQVLNPGGIWYEAVSGIWKTVWMEPVAKTHIERVYPSYSIAAKTASFDIRVNNLKGADNVKIEVLDGGKVIAEGSAAPGAPVEVKIDDQNLWAPDSPYLYNVKVSLLKGSKLIDKADSYFAMREVSKMKDACGYERIALNGDPLFNYGPLDQGWWPDGLLTPPSEEAMIFDMIKLKEMGFNMLRKHIKVEPEQYYYYADSLGLMIWQDMPSGFNSANAKAESIGANDADWNAPKEVVDHWKKEYAEMVENLRFYPSITTWVVFNEGWGQHNTAEMTAYATDLDRSRVINAVTGWTDRGVGDMYDVHNYPEVAMMFPENVPGRISVLGEFGGVSLAVPGHMWKENRNWGYRTMDKSIDLLSGYIKLMYNMESLVAQGLGAAVYTQTTDVEGEINGLITYDREVVKYPADVMNFTHNRLYKVTPSKVDVLLPVLGKDKCPVTDKKSSFEVERKFNVDKDYTNLTLFISGADRAEAWLNGHKVFSGPVRRTRSYESYNLSNYTQYLVKGENVIKVRIVNGTDRKNILDFGLRAF